MSGAVVFDPDQGQVVPLLSEHAGDVVSVNGKTGTVTLLPSDIGAASLDDAAAVAFVLGGS